MPKMEITSSAVLAVGALIAAYLVYQYVKGQAGEAVRETDKAVTDWVRENYQSTYVTGPSWTELVNEFGASCADAIVNGGVVRQAISCPFGWRDRVKAMPGAASTGPGASGTW